MPAVQRLPDHLGSKKAEVGFGSLVMIKNAVSHVWCCHLVDEALNFQELVDAILLPAQSKPKLTAESLLISPDGGPNIVNEKDLSRRGRKKTVSKQKSGSDPWRSLQIHLDRYRVHRPEKKMYSLSQNPKERPRTDDKGGQWPTLTRNIQLWPLDCKVNTAKHSYSHLYIQMIFLTTSLSI